MSDTSERTTCPACGRTGAEPIYRVDGIPVHTSILCETTAAARSCPRRDLELALCSACGFIFNRLFDPSVVAYSPAFEESQHFSTTFSGFAVDLAREIAARCSLGKGSRVIEIGCGKGEFLTELCRIAGCEGIGIDPVFRDDRLPRDRPPGVSFIADWFGPSHYDLVGDVVLCRHTLEHIGLVGDFLAAIRKMIGDRTRAWLVFETPDMGRILREGAFWDIYYEHVSYFTLGSHTRLFRRYGFDIVEARLDFGDQYIVQYATPSASPPERASETGSDLYQTMTLAETFAARVAAVVRQWAEILASARGAGHQVAMWGGGSKAVALLAALPIATDAIQVVDKNPFKQGRYLPGAGHRIMAPSELSRAPPDVVIAMNPIYRDEIRRDLSALGISPRLLAVGA